jgi:hypothetical protein
VPEIDGFSLRVLPKGMRLLGPCVDASICMGIDQIKAFVQV